MPILLLPRSVEEEAPVIEPEVGVGGMPPQWIYDEQVRQFLEVDDDEFAVIYAMMGRRVK
jgi:hypothetical protein